MPSVKSVQLFLILAIAQQGLIAAQDVLHFTLVDEKFIYAKEDLFQMCETSSSEVSSLKWLNPTNDIIRLTGRIHVEKTATRNQLGLLFNDIELGDKGNYTCVATLKEEQISRIFTLHVLKPITFINTLPVQAAAEGSNGVVRCTVDGDPIPSILWKPKFADWILHARFDVKPEGFIIKNVTREDAGEYKCTVLQQSKERTDFTEKIIKFVVHYLPEWSVPIVEKVFSYVTGLVNLTCSAHGEPMPEFIWYRGDEPIAQELGGQYSIFTSKGESILQVLIHNDSDFGDYACIAKNDIGEIQREITIKKGARPKVPSVTPKEFQPTTIELEITSTGEEELKVLGYIVLYKQVEQTWSEASTRNFNIGDSYSIKELKENTEYTIRVASKNAVGLSDYTEDIIQRTVKLDARLVEDGSGASALKQPQLLNLLISFIFGLLAQVTAAVVHLA